eukprot:TRINITY_DN5601_c0_g1_i1.p1 TRINITY_DN5601_c0_g1~~TRINITY_DN5601_c0_g1_i1.p1  ORF type:complete len:249 (-),score=39.45 TRINITY_DN5601_c0_g1_i1:245-991(-)
MGKFDLHPEKIKVGPQTSIFVVIIQLAFGAVVLMAGIYASMLGNQIQPGSQVNPIIGHPLSCNYQHSLVKMVAFGGACANALGQMLISMLGGCVYCCTPVYHPGIALNASMLLFTLSWLAFFASQVCLLSGAFINEFHTSTTIFLYDYDLRQCFVPKPLVYYVGGGLGMAAAVFAVLYYGQAQKSKYDAWVAHGAPTPRIHNMETMKSFVIAGPSTVDTQHPDDDEEVEEEEDDLDNMEVPLRGNNPN